MRELQLFDVEHQQKITISVEEEDYNEIVVNQNLALATTLFDKHQKETREKENFNAAFNVMKNTYSSARTSPTSSSTNTCIASTSSQFSPTRSINVREIESSENSDNTENMKLWTDNNIKHLIYLCKKYDKEFSLGVKKYIWIKISKEMTEKFNQVYTIQQCDTKWKGLKNTYKAVRKHNEQSGNDFKFWKFYELVHDVLFDKPEINAVATCSSARGIVIGSTPSQKNNDDISTPHKYSSSFMKKRNAAESAVERRHKEKMARQDRYLDLMDRLTSSIEENLRKPK